MKPVADRLKRRAPPALRRIARGLRQRAGRGARHRKGPQTAVQWNPASRRLGPSRLTASPVTDLLYGRLAAKDVANLERQLEVGERVALPPPGADRKRVLLALGVHNRIPVFLEKTGLSAAQPPEEVHAMGRGALAAGGTAYYADLVVDAFASAGIALAEGSRILDFGCSSGRVVRVLASAYPAIEWHGCDPIESSISWARQNISNVEFRVSPQAPPLPYGFEFFDCVFAISIWSHFAEAAALRWLDEMSRVINPGGCLALTTHGSQSIAHYASNGTRSSEQLWSIAEALYVEGYWFAPEFGEKGDHGVVNREWGTAFWSAEWLTSKLAPHWQLASFAPGRAEDNQDLYVLLRR